MVVSGKSQLQIKTLTVNQQDDLLKLLVSRFRHQIQPFPIQWCKDKSRCFPGKLDDDGTSILPLILAVIMEYCVQVLLPTLMICTLFQGC